MSDEAPLPERLQVLRLLYNLPATDQAAAESAARPLGSAGRLPLKQRFGPDRYDPLPGPRAPANDDPAA